jgi:hypothetical protein
LTIPKVAEFIVMSQITPQSIVILLTHYRFDLDSSSVETVAMTLVKKYDLQWIIWAIVEAIYQQRYKSVSVVRMLELWLQRGRTNYHFSGDYERSILQVLKAYDEKVEPEVSISPPPRIKSEPPRVREKLDPDVTSPAKFHRHESPERVEFEQIYINEEYTSSPLPQLPPPETESLADDRSNRSNLPRSSEQITLDSDVSNFFGRILNIAGDAL